MPAGRYDFTIEQGADFDRVLTCKDAAGNLIDFTGLTLARRSRSFDCLLILARATSPNAR